MKNIFKSFLIVLAAVSMVTACVEKEESAMDPYATNFVYLKAPLASTYKATFSTAGNWKTQPDTLASYMQIRCTKPAPQDINVTVEIDESMVEAYNTAKGTDYKFFPGLELLQDSFVISKGEYVSADTLKTKITDFDALLAGGTQTYIVPVRMTKASAGTLSESNHFYIFYEAAELFGQMTGEYAGTKIDRSGWKIYIDGRDVTGTLTDGSKYSDVYYISENVINVDLGQVYDNLICFGVEHYGASYSCKYIQVEVSTDNVEFKDLGTYETYAMANAVLEVFDPVSARYVRFTGYEPMSSSYGWDIGEVNIAAAN